MAQFIPEYCDDGVVHLLRIRPLELFADAPKPGDEFQVQEPGKVLE